MLGFVPWIEDFGVGVGTGNVNIQEFIQGSSKGYQPTSI